MLSQELIKELQQIIQEDYLVELNTSQATDFAEMLVKTFQTLIEIEKENN